MLHFETRTAEQLKWARRKAVRGMGTTWALALIKRATARETPSKGEAIVRTGEQSRDQSSEGSKRDRQSRRGRVARYRAGSLFQPEPGWNQDLGDDQTWALRRCHCDRSHIRLPLPPHP